MCVPLSLFSSSSTSSSSSSSRGVGGLPNHLNESRRRFSFVFRFSACPAQLALDNSNSGTNQQGRSGGAKRRNESNLKNNKKRARYTRKINRAATSSSAFGQVFLLGCFFFLPPLSLLGVFFVFCFPTRRSKRVSCFSSQQQLSYHSGVPRSKNKTKKKNRNGNRHPHPNRSI